MTSSFDRGVEEVGTSIGVSLNGTGARKVWQSEVLILGQLVMESHKFRVTFMIHLKYIAANNSDGNFFKSNNFKAFALGLLKMDL